MNATSDQVRNRYLVTLEIVRRELHVLEYSWRKLSAKTIDRKWVESFEEVPDDAEAVEAFVSRFGRLQDTIGDKLLPRALAVVLERPGSMLDNLNSAERLGWIDDATEWAVVRELRNRLVHEYMTDAQRFAEDLIATRDYVPKLREVCDGFLALAKERFGVQESDLEAYLITNNQSRITSNQ